MAEKSSLQQAREVAGLSVEQIASLTNIRPAVIRDLENNSVELCGGIAYARGHIRSIVSAINQKTPKSFKVDADLLVAQMEAAQSEDGRKIIDRLAENNVADKPIKEIISIFTSLVWVVFICFIFLYPTNTTSTNLNCFSEIISGHPSA